ncbi:hypothetical protein SAMN05421771_4292 [Granulicella pectinivorans]|uniref:FecR family protein n=1 Tax=Granulicella pectinivorans TaxID=474950 RepID=A0A1I6N170_9BACT|nr:hypothetical protein [Granulicella pectinivorans]SFS21686.1 hypothetical protein SAMN05421771_4292 [Granulicella pectinivorans]
MKTACTMALLAVSCASFGQQKIGSVAMQDATVAGTLEVTGGRALLVGSSSVTARDHAAEVALERGGTVTICQTSGLHLSSGTANAGSAPLMLALDRGAIEVKMNASANDAVLTPDIRFSVKGGGPLDLRLRVTRNGDTCVEHRGANAPTLVLSDSFGEATYELHAGQHVLFEHGNLREVVDHESSPCGCPPRTMSLAEASLSPANDKAGTGDVAATHPFPAAESAGLTATPEVPQSEPGVTHTQVAANLSFEGSGAPLPATAPATATPPAPEKPHGFAHAIGHFFKRIFGGSPD